MDRYVPERPIVVRQHLAATNGIRETSAILKAQEIFIVDPLILVFRHPEAMVSKCQTIDILQILWRNAIWLSR